MFVFAPCAFQRSLKQTPASCSPICTEMCRIHIVLSILSTVFLVRRFKHLKYALNKKYFTNIYFYLPFIQSILLRKSLLCGGDTFQQEHIRRFKAASAEICGHYLGGIMGKYGERSSWHWHGSHNDLTPDIPITSLNNPLFFSHLLLWLNSPLYCSSQHFVLRLCFLQTFISYLCVSFSPLPFLQWVTHLLSVSHIMCCTLWVFLKQNQVQCLLQTDTITVAGTAAGG